MFGRKKKPPEPLPTCFLCGVEVERGAVPVQMHLISHLTKLDDGWAWQCSCGIQDGVYQMDWGAAQSLEKHIAHEHRR